MLQATRHRAARDAGARRRRRRPGARPHGGVRPPRARRALGLLRAGGRHRDRRVLSGEDYQERWTTLRRRTCSRGAVRGRGLLAGSRAVSTSRATMASVPCSPTVNRPARRFRAAIGVIDRRTFADVAAEANRWAALLRARPARSRETGCSCSSARPPCGLRLSSGAQAGRHGALFRDACERDLSVPRGALRERRNSSSPTTKAHPSWHGWILPVEWCFVEEVATRAQELASVQPTHDTASDDVAFILYTSGRQKDRREPSTQSRVHLGERHTGPSTGSTRRPGDLVWYTPPGTGWAGDRSGTSCSDRGHVEPRS